MVFFLCIPCLTLILYFLIVSLFVPRYRIYIKDAWRCFIDKLRGRKCPVSFDKKMHQAFVMWLTRKNKVGMARFFNNKRNFDITLGIVLIVFTIASTWLFWLLIKFLFIKSPCDNATNTGICLGNSA